MTFNPNTRLDPGQVTDRRGMGGAGGLAVGGGGIGLVLLLAYMLLGGDPSSLGPILEPGAVTGPGSSQLATDCKTGEDANQRDDCRILGYVNSIQAYWTETFTASGKQYQPVDTVLFSGATSSGCGSASAATGPFYCPTDQLVYLDLDFFKELRSRFGAQGGSLAQGYVHRPRVRPPRPGPPRTCCRAGRARRAPRAARSGSSCRPTASRACGPITPRAPGSSSRSPMPRSPTGSTPRRRSATTGSSSRRPARSIPTPGRTARRRSASNGSRPATRAGDLGGCDTFKGNV